MPDKCRIDGEELYAMVDEAVISLCQELRDSGKQCYLVGGATRDLLMGEKPKDWDLTTDATPEEVMEIFKDDRVIPTGVEHGTVTVLKGGEPFEITTFRTEGKYSDGRRPDYVRFTSSLEEDLERRDLTINSVAYDPLNDKIVTTPNDGIDDLRNRVIRAVGDPGERFREDGLRTMRVCRFASRLDFDVEEETLRAVKENVGMIDKISEERIRDELMGILKQSDNPSIGINCLRDTGLLDRILPEVGVLESIGPNSEHHAYNVYKHTTVGMDAIPKEEYMARLGMLLHDTGKKPARAWSDRKGRYVSTGHENYSAVMAEEIMKRLKFSSAEIAKVKSLVQNHMMHDSSEWSDKTIRRFVNRVGEDNIDELLIMHYGDLMGKGRDIKTDLERLETLKSRIQKMREESGKAGFTAKDLAITGHDVMDHLRLKPGPEVGRVLNYLTDKVMDEPSLNNRRDLIKMMEKVKCNE